MEIVFNLGIVLVVGYFLGLIAEKLAFPKVTAYLLAGVLFSNDLLGHVLSIQFNGYSEQLIDICLGIIAFIVGGKINLREMQGQRRTILTTTALECITPVAFVFISFIGISSLFGLRTEFAILLASVAATTAPAATIAVMEQFRPKGEMTNLTLGIVTLDDAFGIILFSLVTGFFLTGGTSHVVSEITGIGTAVFVGSLGGYLLSKFSHLSKTDDYLLPLLIGMIFILEGLSGVWHFSSLLACIVLGAVSNNTHQQSTKFSLLLPIQHIEEFIFIIFFAFAGMHFSTAYFAEALPFILGYLLARGLGKYIGAFFGARLSGTKNKAIPKYLGLTLMPQAGIAIGLIFQFSYTPEIAELKYLLINTILGSTIVYEVAGPFLAKYAFHRVGEIRTSA